jgi:prophage regulatory protein
MVRESFAPSNGRCVRVLIEVFQFFADYDQPPSSSEWNTEDIQMTNRFLRREAVEQLTGLRRSTIYDLMRRGEFPRPVMLTNGKRAVAWLESEISNFQKTRIEKRDQAPSRKSKV